MGIGVHVLGHPVVRFQRDKAGKLAGVGEGQPESLMHLEIDRQAPESMAAVQHAVEGVLADDESRGRVLGELGLNAAAPDA